MSDYGYCPVCDAPGVKRQNLNTITICLNGHKRFTGDFHGAPKTERVREALIESYFVMRVKDTGGEQRKVTFPGHPGAPDRWAGWPTGFNALVELKRPDGKPEPHQAREHAKLRRCGFRVEVLSTKAQVDAFIEKAVKG